MAEPQSHDLVRWPREPVLPRNEAQLPPDPVAYVLSLAASPWRLHPVWELLRASGTVEIPCRAEPELAAALHFLVGLALNHGDGWADEAERQLAVMKAKVDAKEGQAANG